MSGLCQELVDADERPKTFEDFRANALNAVEFIDRAERTELFPMLDDSLGKRRANAREEFEFGLGRGVNVDDRGDCGLRRAVFRDWLRALSGVSRL